MSYSKKYRERTIEYRQAGHTLEETHQTFKVSRSTIQIWEKQLKETGDLGKKKLHRSFRKIDPDKLKAYVAEHPDAYQSEIVNANWKMPIFAETECHFSPNSIQVYTALTTNITCRLEARQALIYQLVLGLTGENGKYNFSKAVHIYPPFSDIPCSAKNYKIAPALTVDPR